MTPPRPAHLPADSVEGASRPATALRTEDLQAGADATDRLLRAMTGPASSVSAIPSPTSQGAQPGALRIGRLAQVESDGSPLVLLPGARGPLPARTVVPLAAHHAGRDILVAIAQSAEGGVPVVTGLLREPAPAVAAPPASTQDPPFEIEADGQRVVLEARQQLVLRCGAASVTLTREGKILLRGAYVSSRASGVHRIQGGSVEIN